VDKTETTVSDLAALRRRVAELEVELAAAVREAGARRAIESALQGSEARGRALLDSLLDPTVVIDSYGTIQASSASVERVPGASHWVHHDAAERVNQLLCDFFAPALAPRTT